MQTVAQAGGAKGLAIELVGPGAVKMWQEMFAANVISGCEDAESVEDAAAVRSPVFVFSPATYNFMIMIMRVCACEQM